MEERDETKVAVNHGEQCSIWPAGRDSHWVGRMQDASKDGMPASSKEVWTDILALGLRKTAGSDSR